MKKGITLSVLALAAISSATLADSYYKMTGSNIESNRMDTRLSDRNAAAAPVSHSGTGNRGFYIAPVVSWNEIDSDSGLDDSPGYGLRIGLDMSRQWSVELSLDYVKTDETNSRITDQTNDVRVSSLSFNGIRRFGDSASFTPYALAGVGVVKTGSFTNEYDGVAASLGGGVLVPVPNWPAQLRAEIKTRYTDSDSFQDEDDYLDWVMSLGIQFNIDLSSKQQDSRPDYRVSVAAPEKEVGLDTDRDGVPDQRDRCPNTGSGISVNPRGCEVDTDSDGVVDSKDQCLDTDIGVVVGKVGCALFLDVDDDGVLNEDDKCPNTEAGAYVDRNGCAASAPKKVVKAPKMRDTMAPKMEAPQPSSDLPIAETLPLDGYSDSPTFSSNTILLDGVEFEYKSTRLTSRAKQSLQEYIERFRSDRNLVAEVAGHTDSKASRAYNQRLSERRAESVRRFLVDSGVNASQLTTRGYGESQPIASNSTESGKARNRRVELRMLSQ